MSNVVEMPKAPYWTLGKINEDLLRSRGAANITLPIDQFVELLLHAETVLLRGLK